jgi:glycosyltransferase involved in cell wall biosynthesis
MRICFLSSLHTPTDKRVFDKEAVSLAAAGFEVIHLAPGPKGLCVKDGVQILTYPSARGIWGRIWNGPKLFWQALRLKADCYHCNEVDSWMLGVALKVFLSCKVVFDAHEAYPEEFAESRFPKALRPSVSFCIRLLFRLLTAASDRIVLAKASIASDFPNGPDKRVLVRNYVSIAYAQEDSRQRAKTEHRLRMRIIHVGLISRSRGWPQLLASLCAASEEMEILFVGQFNDGSEPEFHACAAQLGVADRVSVEPWLPFHEAFRRVADSDVGVVAFQPGRYNHVHALPHKMFDYMVAGLPIVVPSFAVEVSRIVREADCGLIVDSADPSSIREALEFLARRADERTRLGENGRQAVLTRYNWDREARTLENMYWELFAPESEPPSSESTRDTPEDSTDAKERTGDARY